MQSSATAWEAIVPAAKTSPYRDRKRDATVLTQLSHPDGRPWDSSTEQLLQQLEACIFLTRPSITIKPEHTVFLVLEAIHSDSGMGSIVFGAGKNKYKTPKSWLQVQLIFSQGSSLWNQWVLVPRRFFVILREFGVTLLVLTPPCLVLPCSRCHTHSSCLWGSTPWGF